MDDAGTYIVSASDGDVTNAEKIVLVVKPLSGNTLADDPLLIEGSNNTIQDAKLSAEKQKSSKGKNKIPASLLNSMQADQPAEGYPTVTVDPEEIRVKPGDIVTLRCNASGEEPMKFYWKSGSLEYIPVHVRVSRGALIFKSIRKEDAGFYYCVAFNELGQVSARANIIVDEPKKGETYYYNLLLYRNGYSDSSSV
jgi:hypothetical protein